jgi:LysM repeat protein
MVVSMRGRLTALALAMVLPVPALLGSPARSNVVVQPGETLSEIAERNGVSLTRLMQANGISNPDLVVAGTRLVIPGRGSSGPSGSSTVTVQPGDTLSGIADRHGVSVNRLMQMNGISDPNLVVAGQRLVVRSAAASASSLPTAPYTIKSGETLSEIAQRFGTSTDRLMQLNRISNPNLVVAGTRLAIPGRPTAAGQGRPQQHVVQPGESLSTIADRYGMGVNRLMAINNISDPDLVWAGARLKLQSPPAAKPARRAASAKPATAKPAVAKAKPVSPQPQQAAKPAATTATTPVVAKPEPQIQPQPQPATQTAAAPRPQEQRQEQPKPMEQTATVTQVTVTPTTASPSPATSTASAVAARPVSETAVAAKPVSKQPVASKPVAAKPATTTAKATATTGKPSGADWRSYGPLQVDWSNWQPMGGSYVAPTLNGDGQALYLAVNCGARKLNATSQAGQWKSWDSPQTDFEQRLITDLCRAKGT